MSGSKKPRLQPELFDLRYQPPKRGPTPKPNAATKRIKIAPATEERLNIFFSQYGDDKTANEKIEILLNLAETHTDLIEGQSVNGDSTASNQQQATASRGGHSAAIGQYREAGQKCGGQCVSADGTMGGYEIDDDVFDHELAIADETPVAEEAEFVVEEDDWEDEADILEREGPSPLQSFYSQSPSGEQILNAAPLLSKHYYVEWSVDARKQACFEGSKRSVAKAANTRRFIVEQREIRRLLEHVRCAEPSCGELIDTNGATFKTVGYAVECRARCKGVPFHDFFWASSAKAQHTTKEQSEIYVINAMVPAAVIVTGQNYSRMERWAQALRLVWGSKSHHFRIQRGCVMPAVQECTEMAQAEMHERLRKQGGLVILAGDGQYESPGKTAATCTYTLVGAGIEKEVDGEMKFHHSGYVISQAVGHRNHVAGSAAAAEHAGLHAALRPLFAAKVNVAEIITDECSQVLGDFRKANSAANEEALNIMCGRRSTRSLVAFQTAIDTALEPCSTADAESLLSNYAAIRHSLDIWHKAKNIAKKVNMIAREAPENERKTFHLRATDLANHLWKCAELAKGDANSFKERWLRCLKHIAGNHEDCEHDESAQRTPPLTTGTTAFNKLEKYVRENVGYLAEHLCRFRHTGILESFHALCLVYAAKRHYYDYDVMVLRKRLAAFDHNHNVGRVLLFNDDGEVRYSHHWSKASHDFVPRFYREPKRRAYIGHLMAHVLYRRMTSDYDFQSGGGTTYSRQHPRRIKASIATKEQTAKATFESWISRFPGHRLAENADSSDDDTDSDSEDGELEY